MDFYSIAEVAEMSRQSQKTIRRHIAAGKLKAEKIGNCYRITKEDYEKWLVSDLDPEKDNIFNETIVEGQSTDTVNWIDITDNWVYDGWANINYRNGLNFIDLFSGAGGLSCGLTMAGFTPVGSVEIMPEAVATYRYNFIEQKGFNENVQSRDIREASVKQELYDSVADKHIHLIVGGFPCQGFSMAGHRVITDPRNSLYLEMLEIVKHIKPDFVVMENVEGLRSMLDGKVEAKIISDYKEAGYDINVTVLNSADYGVPQIRRRVIFIGNRHGLTNYHPKPIYSPDNYVTLGECIKRFMAMPENKQVNHIFTRHSEKMMAQIAAVPEGQSLYGNYSDAWKKSPWDKPSCTVKENHGGVNIHPKLPRVLTPRELAALQSFPDDFIFQGSKKWQLVQIGNAVPCLLGKAIGIAISKAIEGRKRMSYSKKLRYVQNKLQEYITTILKVYGNELLLLLEDCNLLQNPNNCIESSTAPGFILEEFIISKLAVFTQNHDGEKEIIITRNGVSTISSSFDCYIDFKNVRILINHKAEKEGRTNAGIAAINKLYTDYVLTEPEQEKAFLVLKLRYKYIISQTDNQRKFYITSINSFFLEEIDFSEGHKQDYRNWSEEFKLSSGRLMVDESFKNQHHIEDERMSYLNTRQFITDLKEQDDT